MQISKKELIRKVAIQSGYFIYEIEDFLHALAIVVSEEVKQGNVVKVDGLGTFIYKPPRPVKNFSPYTGRYMDTISKKSCKFKPDRLFLNLLNGVDETKLNLLNDSENSLTKLNLLNDSEDTEGDNDE